MAHEVTAWVRLKAAGLRQQHTETVLYLRHGWGENEQGWHVQGHVDLIMDNLNAAKPGEHGTLFPSDDLRAVVRGDARPRVRVLLLRAPCRMISMSASVIDSRTSQLKMYRLKRPGCRTSRRCSGRKHQCASDHVRPATARNLCPSSTASPSTSTTVPPGSALASLDGLTATMPASGIMKSGGGGLQAELIAEL